MSTWIGLDISKDTIDVGFYQDDKAVHFKISNNSVGFKQLLKKSPTDGKFVMEATGIYYLSCARLLAQSERFVSVENPLKIKRYSQLNLRRTKTDKKDALLIARYGEQNDPMEWNMPSQDQLECQQLQSAIDLHTTMIQQNKNQIHGFTSSGINDYNVLKVLSRTIRFLEDAKKKIEAKLLKIVKKAFSKELELIVSIPGIGPPTACIILTKVGNASTFERSGQLASFFGITPVESFSGTSIHNKV